MSDPVPDVGHPQVVEGEELLEVLAEVGLDDVGDGRRQHDAKAGAADVPAHDSLGVRVEAGAGRDDLGPGETESLRSAFTHHHHGYGAVTEEPGGHEVRRRRVVPLDRQ